MKKEQNECRRPSVMAIINITPDSFYQGSRTIDEQAISRRTREALAQGAAIIDLGGYSTRPGAEEISPEDEFIRLDRAMRILREMVPDVPVSIDTFRSEIVVRLYDRYGRFTVNDISAGGLDSRMITTVGRLGLPYIAMHSRGTPRTMQSLTDYADVVAEVREFFVRKIDECLSAGIAELTLDPGFGFAKSMAHNFELLSGMHRICEFGLPVLAGLSRKSMIWRTLETTPDEALNGTTAMNWEALRQGASILRVHDVKEAVEITKLFSAFMNSNQHK